MAIRDLLLIAFIFGSLPFCFRWPWVGILVWSWIGYMNPHRLSWSLAESIPFAQVVALTTIGGIFFTKDRQSLPRSRELYLLILLWAIFLLSTLLAVYPASAWAQFNKVSKILLMTFITLLLFQDPKKLRALFWVIALSIGFFGLKGGIWALLTGGQNKVLGPPDSFIAGNTEIGLALNMVLPIFLFLRRGETRPWLRHFLLALFGFSAIAVLLTYSRGALLGLGVVLSLIFLKNRGKILILLLLALGIFLAGSMLPEKWFGRMETIQSHEEDPSATGRIIAWRLSYRMALDRPILGFGFQPFTPEVYQQYLPEHSYHVERSADAHNIFFQVLAEHGFIGVALYAGLILSTMLSLRKMIRMSRKDPSMGWIYHCTQMLEASLAGYLVCGFFLSRSYFDLFYHFVAITIILKQLFLIQRREEFKSIDLVS